MAALRNKPSADVVGEAVRRCLARHCTPDTRLAVGFSGGLDSTVLLHAVAASANRRLAAIHVHHGLSVNADAWATHCAQVCSALDLPLSISRVNVPPATGSGIEAAARSVRRAALLAADADFILLAHHADDQAETILHHLLRGSAVRGVAGMAEYRGRFLRPLLALSRADLLGYAHANGLTWIDDESNADPRYTRNYLRNEVMPVVAARFPAAVARLGAAGEHFAEAQELLDQLAEIDLAGLTPTFPVSLDRFRTVSEARARNLLSWLLHSQGLQMPDATRVREFVRQMREAGPDRHPRLELAGYSLHCAGRQLHLTRA